MFLGFIKYELFPYFQLQLVGALCETGSTQERVLQDVTPDSYEDTLYSVLLYTSQVRTKPKIKESS